MTVLLCLIYTMQRDVMHKGFTGTKLEVRSFRKVLKSFYHKDKHEFVVLRVYDWRFTCVLGVINICLF